MVVRRMWGEVDGAPAGGEPLVVELVPRGGPGEHDVVSVLAARHTRLVRLGVVLGEEGLQCGVVGGTGKVGLLCGVLR